MNDRTGRALDFLYVEAVRIYVFRTKDVSGVVRELTDRGLTLEPEKHGNGPDHFSIELENAVVEIYPGAGDRACDRCSGRVVEDRPATVCRRCLDEVLAQ